MAEPLSDCPECVERLSYLSDETGRIIVCPRCGRPLNPAGRRPTGRPLWVTVVLLAYLGLFTLLLLAPLLSPVIGASPEEAVYLGLFAAALVAIGITLMVTPAGRHRRPVGRTSILVPLFGTATGAALLVFGGGLAVSEFAVGDSPWPAGVAAGLAWLLWVGVFGWMSRVTDPDAVAGRLYNALLAGSAVELLVAVPLHLVVRRRAECCAGLATGFGIGVGALVMFLVFGPAVVFLYYRRYRQVYGAKGVRGGEPGRAA